MKEEQYRISKVILLAIFVGGVLIIGSRISESVRLIAENGRYIQYDRNKDTTTTGNSTQLFPTKIMDTRTGDVRQN
jgi:hypothetical protein